MVYKRAKELEIGDVIEPRNVDINGNFIVPHGNYLVKHIDDDGHEVIITLDNGQQVSHKLCNHPPYICGKTFYCSWFGETDNICKTGLSYRQILRCGIVPDELVKDFNKLSKEDFNKKYL